jgi:hypothetical protein
VTLVFQDSPHLSLVLGGFSDRNISCLSRLHCQLDAVRKGLVLARSSYRLVAHFERRDKTWDRPAGHFYGASPAARDTRNPPVRSYSEELLVTGVSEPIALIPASGLRLASEFQ